MLYDFQGLGFHFDPPARAGLYDLTFFIAGAATAGAGADAAVGGAELTVIG